MPHAHTATTVTPAAPVGTAGAAGPRTPARTAGTILSRVIVPGWLATGAFMKIAAMNPKLLPPPVLAVIDRIAGALDKPIAETYEPALRVIVGVEIALALAMALAGTLSRLLAFLVLALFCGILGMVLLSGSSACNCMGPSGPNAWVMLSIDAALLIGVIALPTRGCSAPPARTAAYVAIAALVGGSVAYAWPAKAAMQIQQPSHPEGPTTNQPAAHSAGANPPTTDPPAANPPAANPPTAPAGETWPGMPATMQGWYAFEAKEWLNKRLDQQEMARLISGMGTFNPNRGRVHIVFMRDDCDHCHELLTKYFSGKLDAPTLSVAIPDAAGAPLENPCAECAKAKLYMTGGKPMYLITTPVLITVKDGVVISICTDPENPNAVRATLDAGKQP